MLYRTVYRALPETNKVAYTIHVSVLFPRMAVLNILTVLSIDELTITTVRKTHTILFKYNQKECIKPVTYRKQYGAREEINPAPADIKCT